MNIIPIRLAAERLEQAHGARDRRTAETVAFLVAVLVLGSAVGWWALLAMPVVALIGRRLAFADEEVRSARDEMRKLIAPPRPTPYAHGHTIRARRQA